MTKDKFAVLCEQVLVPRIGDLMHGQLVDVQEALDVIARELIRIGAGLDRVALNTTPPPAEHADK